MKKKKKTQQRFAICYHGYDVDEVESYIALQQAKASEVQMEQKERIVALKTQCADLNCELASLRSREEQIKTTLVSATEKAEKMTGDVKARYSAELQRLKLFRAKWTKAYDEMKERYHFDKDALNMESVAVSTEMELQKFLAQDFSLDKGGDTDEMEAYFRSEVERLTRQEAQKAPAYNSSVVPSGVEQLKEKLKEAGEKKAKQAPTAKRMDLNSAPAAAFSIEEALHPTESLEEICQYLLS